MSASGILNSGAVVFYHPLDNSTEHTLSQDWVGSAEYAPGKVGSSLFANIGTIVTTDNPSGVLSEGFLTQGLANAIKLTDNKFAISYPDSANVVGVRIVNISGTTPTFGAEYLFTAPDVTNVHIQAFSPSSIIIIHNSGDTPSDRPFIRQLDIDISDVIVSGDTLIMDDFLYGSIDACAIDDTRIFIALGSTTQGHVAMAELSDGVWTSGNVLAVSGMRLNDTCFKLSSSGCIFNYEDDLGDGQVRVAQLPVSGTDIVAIGAAQEFSPNYGLGVQDGDHTNGGMCRLTDNKFMIFFKEGNRGRLMAADVVGNNITLGTDIDIISFYGHGQITRLTDDKSMIIYKNQDAFPVVSNARVATVDGLTVSVGSLYVFSDEDPGVTDSQGPINAIAGIDPASAFVFYSEHTAAERRSKILHVDTSDTSLMGSGYPSMSGYTRVSACMWARNLTAPVSTVNVERGYSIQMTSGSIVLGGAATWNDGGITTLMDVMNDGEPHFIVVDFENTGSNWNLNTSIDGAAWIDQGTQNSGSLSPVLTDTSGEVSVTNPEPGQWIDETVLWGGDKTTLDKFTEGEVFSLYSLALSGSTMNQFVASATPPSTINNNFDMYILNIGEFAASGDLYVAGPLQMTGFFDLFIVGTGVVPEEVVTLGRPIDWLLKTSDHNPQIIGTFATTVSGVNISVWDVTNGANTAMSIPNSGCYQIGNTGRWGWSTTNLPSTQGHARHYFYQMTSNLSTTFDGQFLLDLPEGAKWIHPSEFGQYLL